MKKEKQNQKALLKLENVCEIFKEILDCDFTTTKYETHVKKDNHTLAWLAQRKQYVSLSLFPPYHPKWETIKITSQQEAKDQAAILKKKYLAHHLNPKNHKEG